MPIGSGMIRFMVKVEGKAAHGAQKWLGVSAFEKALTIHSALMKLEERRMRTKKHHLFRVYPKFPALNVGIVRSGTTPYTTPDAAILEGRYSVSPVETIDEAKKEFESQVITAAKKDPWMKHVHPTIVWSQIGQGLFPPFEISTENPLVKSICKSLKKIIKKEPKVLGKLGATDASWLNTYGHTPTIIFGPGHIECSHTIDEYIHKNALITATKALAEFLVNWCICET